MSMQSKKGSSSEKLLIVFAVLFILMIALSVWITQELKKSTRSKESIQATRIQESRIPKYEIDDTSEAEEEIVRKTRVKRGSDYREHVFYRGGKEVARLKESTKGVFEITGRIPNGKVKFFDEYKNTYGEEYYRQGLKHGFFKTYYKNGNMKIESYYEYGKLRATKKYYADGSLRFEIDYTDAPSNISGKEVGIGKLYYSDGILKYEWNITKSKPIGYKKSYGQKGDLIFEAYFDAEGNKIEKK